MRKEERGEDAQAAWLRAVGCRSAANALKIAASTLAVLGARDLGMEEVYVKVHSAQHQHIADALGATDLSPCPCASLVLRDANMGSFS